MIAFAKKELKKNKSNPEVIFYEADICNIPEKDGYFDVSITTRVLINLPSWQLQEKAIDEMFRVTKSGGLILFSEAFLGGLKNINKLRKLFDLAPLTIHSFNKYLDEKLMEKYLKGKRVRYEIINFSSIYYIGSRVIREIYPDKGEKQSFKHFINDFFFDLEKKKNKLDFGIQKLFVIRK
jgi:ubiquinone/menaquinone biosynthesis C-methylase UbiE